MQAISAYPVVNMVDFGRFTRGCNIVDEKFPNTRLDTLYKNACQLVVGSGAPTDDLGMRRWSFLEFIVRAANDKYRDRGLAATTTEAVRKFLTDNLLGKNFVEPWQEFRKLYIWTLPVNDLLKVNLHLLDEIYGKYASKNKRLQFDQCCKIFTTYSNLALSMEHSKLCFAMSKMTTVNESTTLTLMVIEFVEFLEMICRVADIKFRGSNLETEELQTKVGYVLDELMPLIGARKVEVDCHELEISDSDEDY